MKSTILLLAFGACILTVSSANIPEKELKPDTSVARGGWGSASEFFTGPPAIFFAPVIAVGLIIVLWVAAYNTLRSPPPKIGFGGGAQGGGWGGWNQSGGWGGWPAPAAGGWAAAGSEQYETAAAPGGAPAQAVATPAASAVEQTVAASGQRSFNDLTHRILTSIERGERMQY